MTSVKSVILTKNLEVGLPTPEHFEIKETPFFFEKAVEELQEGSVVVKVDVISPDPLVLALMKSAGFMPTKSGEVLKGFTVSRVLASKNKALKEGDIIGALLPLSTFQTIGPQQVQQSWKLTGYVNEDQLSYGAGVLGLTGGTAYAGLVGVLQPKAGETIFISSAAGAVGTVVGMMAKNVFGCKVIGSCGSDEKVKMLTEKHGFDGAINYKKATNAGELTQLLKQVAPEGIDMYFENVGGMHFDAAMNCLRPKGRVAICGMISNYSGSNMATSTLQFNPMLLLRQQQRIEGFVAGEYLYGYKGKFLEDMHRWLLEEKVTAIESIHEEIESFPYALMNTLNGNHVGKVIVKL